MSHGLRGCVKGLCLSAIYTASVYLCPAVRKKRLRGASVPDGCRETGRLHYYNSNKISAHGKTPLNPSALIGMVFTSFPIKGGAAALSVPENAPEYDICKKAEAIERCGAPRPNRGANVPHRTSLDILRVTLNLARGNIEDQSAAAAS